MELMSLMFHYFYHFFGVVVGCVIFFCHIVLCGCCTGLKRMWYILELYAAYFILIGLVSELLYMGIVTVWRSFVFAYTGELCENWCIH